MSRLGHRWRARSGRALALVAVLGASSVGVVAVSGLPARAQETDPTTTTEPAPDPTTTTEPAPDPTTTTTEPAPDPSTDPTTTTEPTPDTTTTSSPPDPAAEAEAGKLAPGEALTPRPEFGALTGHQRDLVQELQTATDTYALRRVGLFDLAGQVAAAKAVLDVERANEFEAVTSELIGPAEADLSGSGATVPAVSVVDVPAGNGRTRTAHDVKHEAQLTAFRALRHRLAEDHRDARLVRVQAQAAVAALSARLATQTQAVADALGARTAAESAIEDELGSDAVRARPDGITATLASVQAGQPDPIVIGGISHPIPGAALASPFGLRNDPLSGGAGFHPGLDFAASSGTPIHAAAEGVVVTAGDCGGYGNCVVIDHGSSMATLYAHQSQVLVRVGERVDAGDVIGLVGSTGLSTGAHLHFEVRLHGLPIDPLLALPPGG